MASAGDKGKEKVSSDEEEQRGNAGNAERVRSSFTVKLIL
jgi:hypothetical protein